MAISRSTDPRMALWIITGRFLSAESAPLNWQSFINMYLPKIITTLKIGTSNSYQLDQSFSILRVDGRYFFYSNSTKTFFKQTVEILIRCCILQHLIWVCTICLCTIKRMLGLYGLTPYLTTLTIPITHICIGLSLKMVKILILRKQYLTVT